MAQLEFIDTPGLHASSTMHAANKALLRKMKAAYKWHKPNYVFYVDRWGRACWLLDPCVHVRPCALFVEVTPTAPLARSVTGCGPSWCTCVPLALAMAASANHALSACRRLVRCRADAARPSLGELTVLGQVNEAFGAQVWQQSMLFLTHAHACRANMGAQYDQYTRQRRSILLQMVRQAASNNMVRCDPGERNAKEGSGLCRGYQA